jgi:hypothetical protein
MSGMAKRTLPIIVATYLLAGGFSAAHAAIPSTERAALIALYTDTDGDFWLDNTGWKTPPLAGDGFAMPGTECDWYSVWCDAGETTVQEIDAKSNFLFGSIPAALADLTNLQYLVLSSNLLSGSIPSALGTLGSLGFLYLNSNQLAGGIPPELGDLFSLLDLSLYNNDLTGSIPPDLGDLANLKTLWLDGNNLTGSIPPQLGSLTSIEALFLFNNQLSGSIPPELGSLANICASSSLAKFARLDGECSGDTKFLDLVAEGVIRNTEQLRRLGLVVVGALQCLLDQVLLQLLE